MIHAATRALASFGAWSAALLLVGGAVLRLTARDRFDGIAVLFYATPWPVLMVGGALVAIIFARLRLHKPACAFAVFALLAGGAWIRGSWINNGETAHSGGVRLVLWNVSRPERRLPAIARWLRAQDADVIAIAEAQPKAGPNLERWRAEFPQHHLEVLPQNMLCIARNPLRLEESGSLAYGSFFALLRTEVRGRSLTIIQVDLSALPFSSRREPLARLTALVRAHSGEDLIVLGDFNTPRESVHFDALRGELTNCFEAAGSGFPETWPFPFPVLSLDQIWLGRRLRPHRCRHGWPPLSDHRPVMLEMDVPQPARLQAARQ